MTSDKLSGAREMNTPYSETIAWPGWPRDETDLEYDKRARLLPNTESRARLYRSERQWAKIQPWLQSQGYMLRPRFRPGWIPSWKMKEKVDLDWCEDAIDHTNSGADVTMDAIRISDGCHVCLKRIPCRAEDSTEVAITQFLSQDEQRKDPRNHAIPLLDLIQAPDHCFMVLPFCRSLMHHFPLFETVGEVFDMVEQALEGLEYLHGLNIAHRDISIANIMMDPDRIFPRGFHMDSDDQDTRGRELSGLRSRTRVGGVKYYIIDFGESMKVGPDESVLIDVWSKAAIHAPETLEPDRPPYDPFKADIYTMGSSLKYLTVQDYEPYFDMLSPLFDTMMAEDPSGRPSASAVLEQFRAIKRTYSRTALHGRIRTHKYNYESKLENEVERVFRDTWHWTKQCIFAVLNLKW
ncbi:kinase-like protein [Dentipellis sp. KUC8613]|nr:kinase-like protein [Dentipellis sp. KUC8613]